MQPGDVVFTPQEYNPVGINDAAMNDVSSKNFAALGGDLDKSLADQASGSQDKTPQTVVHHHQLEDPDSPAVPTPPAVVTPLAAVELDRLPGILADDAALEQIEEARLVGFDWVRAMDALPNEYLYYYLFTQQARERILSHYFPDDEDVEEGGISGHQKLINYIYSSYQYTSCGCVCAFN